MKKGGSGGGNSFVTAEVLLMIWKIFLSPLLQPKIAIVNKYLSLKVFLMGMCFFVCVVLIMILVNGSHVPAPLRRLSNCHDKPVL